MLQHTNIPRVYHLLRKLKRFFIIMLYIEGTKKKEMGQMYHPFQNAVS